MPTKGCFGYDLTSQEAKSRYLGHRLNLCEKPGAGKGGRFLKVPITNGPEKLYVIVYITKRSFDRFADNISKQNKVYWSLI